MFQTSTSFSGGCYDVKQCDGAGISTRFKPQPPFQVAATANSAVNVAQVAGFQTSTSFSGGCYSSLSIGWSRAQHVSNLNHLFWWLLPKASQSNRRITSMSFKPQPLFQAVATLSQRSTTLILKSFQTSIPFSWGLLHQP